MSSTASQRELAGTGSDVQIRRARVEDAEVCGRIFYEAFTAINRDHNFAPEIPSAEAGIEIMGMLFSHPEHYCVVAESDGRVVGSNCIDERCEITGLGPLSVDPNFQNGGIGRRLMSALLDRVQSRGSAGVRLMQSAFHNRSLSLYAKLGFDVREPMSVMTGKAIGSAAEGGQVRSAVMGDVDRCNQLCQRVHGVIRGGELRDGIGQGTALVVEREGRITGYATGFGYLAHAVAEANPDLQVLIMGAKNVSGPGILVPTRNAELFRWCLANGLRVLQPMTLMTIGFYKEPEGAYLPSVNY
ncbi:MAG: GNAT family N-acetyltransferase [Bryobacteraceae bacterium]|nr:GNAT family N-acetyltransferase [Bryobacteraceae bacterium]